MQIIRYIILFNNQVQYDFKWKNFDIIISSYMLNEFEFVEQFMTSFNENDEYDINDAFFRVVNDFIKSNIQSMTIDRNSKLKLKNTIFKVLCETFSRVKNFRTSWNWNYHLMSFALKFHLFFFYWYSIDSYINYTIARIFFQNEC